MPGESRSKSQATDAKTAAAARTSPVLIPQGVLEGQSEIPLNRPVTTVGSNENARLHLLSRTVSKGHAIFVNSGGGTYVADLASRTGVLINGKLARDAVLKNGDRVQIGKFVFRYRLPPNVPTPADLPEAPAAAVIVVGWPALPVTGRVVSIGRSDRSDISLTDDASVSAPHAVIFQVDAQWYIRDMGSRTGTHVNGKAIHQQALNFGDRVVIGSSTILFQPGAMLDEASSLIQPEPEEIAPFAATSATDDAIPLADDESAVEPETTQPAAVDWSATPATELPEAPATDLSTDSAEPLPIEDVKEPTLADSAPIPFEESAPATQSIIEPLPLEEDSELPEEVVADLPTESAEPLPVEEFIEPVWTHSATISHSDAEPISLPESIGEPMPLEEVFEFPADDGGVTDATELPEEVAADHPTESAEPLPVADVIEPAPSDPATIPVEEEESIPSSESVTQPLPVEEDSDFPAVDWDVTPATDLPEAVIEPASTHSAPIPRDEIEATPASQIPEPELADAVSAPSESPAIAEESDDDLIDWSLPETEPVAHEPVAHEPVAKVGSLKIDAPPIIPAPDPLSSVAENEFEWTDTTDAVLPIQELTHHETPATPLAIPEPISNDHPLPLADDSEDEIFDWSEPAPAVETLAPAHIAPDADDAPVEIIAAEPEAIEAPLPKTEPEIVPAESNGSATHATELTADPVSLEPETESIESDEEAEHVPVPVDISESSWINTPTPTPPPIVSPPPIPPLPTWPAATARPATPPPIDVHTPVEDFVFVPTDETHDPDSVDDLLFFGDESHEVATDPVLVDRLAHSKAVSPDATFDSAIEESLTESHSELTQQHQHDLENRAAHFDPKLADAAFDAALEESFAPPAVASPAPVVTEPEKVLPAAEVIPNDLDDRVANFTAALADPTFDAALEDSLAEEPNVPTIPPTSEYPAIDPDPIDLPTLDLEDLEPESTTVNPEPELPAINSQAAGFALATPVLPADSAPNQPASPDDGFDDAFADQLATPIPTENDDAEPSWLTEEPAVAHLPIDPNRSSTTHTPELEPEHIDLPTLDLEDLEPEAPDANISWSSLADEAPTEPPAPEPTTAHLEDFHDHSGEEAIGWSALVNHDDLPAHGVTTISDQAAGPNAQISEASDVADLDFLEFPEEHTAAPFAPTDAVEEPLIPGSAAAADELPPPISEPPALQSQPSDKPSGPEGPGHGPSIFGFQFEGGSFLGGMPISLHQPEPPVSPVFDATKVTPSGIGSMVPPPPIEPPKRKTNRPLTVPRPALPTIGGAAATGKSLSNLTGETASTWAATPIIPPTAKPGERSTHRQKRNLTTAFNAPGMAAKNADVFSQLASPIGVEVFAGKSTVAFEEALPELAVAELVEPTPAPAPIAQLPQLRKTRAARWPWLLLLLGVSVGGLWALAYRVPQISSKLVTAKLVGSLQFDGFTSLSPVDAHAFLAQQQARLASDEVRLGAQQILENNHQTAGFTASSDDYSKTVDMQSLAWSGNTLQLTFNTNDPLAGSAQVNAVLASLAKSDHDLDETKAKAKQAADDAHADSDSAAARAQQLSTQRRTQVDLAQDSPDLTTVTTSDQDATILTQKWNDAKTTRENNEAVLADLRAKDPSRPVDVEADPQVVELRKRLDPLKEQIARLKGINAVATAPGTSNAIPAGATTRPQGDVDPLLAPLQQQADSLAKKIDQRRAELAPDAGLSAAQREVDMANRIENLSVKITTLRQTETQAKIDSDVAVAKAKKNHERLSAARLAGVKAEDLLNQQNEAESDQHRAIQSQTDREALLANCVTVAAVPIAPPTQFPATDIRAPMFALSAGIVAVILGLMIVGDLRRPRYKAGIIPVAAPRTTPPIPVVPWPRPRELNGLKTSGQPEEVEQEQPPIIGEPDQVFGV